MMSFNYSRESMTKRPFGEDGGKEVVVITELSFAGCLLGAQHCAGQSCSHLNVRSDRLGFLLKMQIGTQWIWNGAKEPEFQTSCQMLLLALDQPVCRTSKQVCRCERPRGSQQ